MRKILIIEPNWLGDVLFTTPAIRAIKQHSPHASVTVLVHKRCADILKNNPFIDNIILLEKDRGLKGFIYKLNLIKQLKGFDFNTVFLFSRSMSHALMCKLALIPEIIGYSNFKRFFLLTHKLKEKYKIRHRVEYFLDLARFIGIDTENKNYEFPISGADEESAQSLLLECGISAHSEYFVVNPGGNWMPKRWPKEGFAKLCDELFSKYSLKIVITGAEKDIALGENIKNLCKTAKPVNLCGKTTIFELAAVLKNAKAVIANDSGPMHIAISQKTPTAALFGPTNPAITGPYGDSKYIVVEKEIDCPVPCYNKNCRNNRCMEAVTTADVMEAVASVIASE
ncbi:MAG: lipopolysaccharide heptosyltransferase II [Candidatus Omnitrophica bacterium]|nr:lipopolysaccharide heptosyltransferase II [Candidatus Omnitrophota bacterium]